MVDVDSGYPTYKNIAFGVECKAVSNFAKSILKEVLGVRRELSLLDRETKSLLSARGGRPSVTVACQASLRGLARLHRSSRQFL